MVTLQCGDVCFTGVNAVLFDKDGTLADSQIYLSKLGQQRAYLIDQQVPGLYDPLLRAFGLATNILNPEGLLAVGTRLENEIAAAAYVTATGKNWVPALTLVKTAFQQADCSLERKAICTPLFPGALEMLRSLAGSGVGLGILSADTTANVEDFIDYYQLNALIQVAVGIDAPPGKPHPAPFWRACTALQLEPSAVLMIGDTTADLEMATAAKARGSVGVAWGWTPSAALHQADAILTQFSEIAVRPG